MGKVDYSQIKKIRRLLCILFILFMIEIFFISGITWECAFAKTNGSDDIVLAVCAAGPTHDWTADVMRYAQEELERVEKDNGWKTIFCYSDDIYEQSQMVVDLVKEGVDCLVLFPMDGASLKTAAISVKQAHIPLVIFDREIPEFAPTATVKGDNWGIGEKTAEYFNNYFYSGTTVLELMGDTSTVPFQRTDGYDSTIGPAFKKIQIGYTEWKRDTSRKLFQDWVQEQEQSTLDEVGAIFTHDDEIALGVLDVLDKYKEEGIRESLFPNLQVISGSSSSQKMYHRIRTEDRYTLFSMTYNSDMIKEAVRTGEQILKGENFDEMKIYPTIYVTKDNVEDYIIEGYSEYNPVTESTE